MRNPWITCGLALLLCLCSLSVASARTPQDLYIIEPVSAEFSGDSPQANREKALEAAKIQAFEMLLKRLVSPTELANAPAPTPDIVEEMALSHRILSEKSSPQKYSAQIAVRFSPTAVKSWLAAHQLTYQEQGSHETLVIPILFEGGRGHMWDEGPWSAAWQTRLKETRDQTLLLPLKDLDDVSALPEAAVLEAFTHPETAGALTHQNLTPLKERYHADDVAFACLEVKSDGIHPALWWPQKIVASEAMMPFAVLPFSPEHTPEAAPLAGISPESLSQTVAAMQEQLAAGPARSALAVPELKAPEHWQEIPIAATNASDIAGIEAKIRGIPGISAVQLRELSLEGAIFALKTALAEDALNQALQAQGLMGRGDQVLELNPAPAAPMALIPTLETPAFPQPEFQERAA